MRHIILSLALLTIGACATPLRSSEMIPVRGQTAVERQILASYRTYASVNASLGAPAVAYATALPIHWAEYRMTIQQRIARDLVNIYGREVPAAERVYLLFGVSPDGDVVEVVRLGPREPPPSDRQTFGGLYQVETLTYVFDRERRALERVVGPAAGEY